MPATTPTIRYVQDATPTEINKSLREIQDALAAQVANVSLTAAYIALPSAYTLTSSYVSVPGLFLTLTRAGIWLVRLVAFLNPSSAAVPQLQLSVAGSAQTIAPTLNLGIAASSAPFFAEWQIRAQSPGTALTIQAKNSSGSGTAVLITSGTSLSALYLTPLNT